MKKRIFGKLALALLGVVFYLSCAYFVTDVVRDSSTVGIEPQSLVEMDKIVAASIEAEEIPGAVLFVGRNGKFVKKQAYGFRQVLPDNQPMTIDTIFDLASVSKVVGTATASMALIEDGKLKLDDKVAQYLPQFAEQDKGDVTLKHLLTHSSGLHPYANYKLIEQSRQSDETKDEALIRYIGEMKKVYPTGKGYKYSCLNFLTLARVNEVVAGESQHDFLRRRVYGPLGMHDTGYLFTDEQIARIAPTIEVEGVWWRGSVHDPLAHYYGAGRHCPGNAGLFSSAPDLAIYAQMILNNGSYKGVQVFKPETIEMMTSIHSPPETDSKRGLGWGIYWEPPYASEANHTPGNYVLGHLGWTGTFILLDQNTKTFMIFLSNRVHPGDDAVPLSKTKQTVRKLARTLRAGIDRYQQ